ncbi:MULTISPECIES: YveK family protein [unclassified Luteococcus]|uniref:YveK family protein n=1 Tax=unclassified Luteococcus TaxID=2639923 RepID=UPI00313C7C8E
MFLEQTFGQRLRKGLLPALIGAVLGALIGVAASFALPTKYTSTAIGLVVANAGKDPATANAGQELALSRSQTFAVVGESLAVAQEVSRMMPGEPDPAQLLGKVQIDPGALVPTLTVTAQADSPLAAQALANAWMKQVEKTSLELETASSKQPLVVVKPIGSATLPGGADQPTGPVLILLLSLLGAASGFVVGMVLLGVRRHQHP